jgi:hypothetical protein
MLAQSKPNITDPASRRRPPNGDLKTSTVSRRCMDTRQEKESRPGAELVQARAAITLDGPSRDNNS